MLILYPCPPPDDWFEPTLVQVFETLINLRQFGFQLSAVLFVDIILYIEQYIIDPIGRTLLWAYVILCGKSEQDVIHNFLEILLCPSRELKTVNFLDYLISRMLCLHLDNLKIINKQFLTLILENKPTLDN